MGISGLFLVLSREASVRGGEEGAWWAELPFSVALGSPEALGTISYVDTTSGDAFGMGEPSTRVLAALLSLIDVSSRYREEGEAFAVFGGC